MWIFLKSLLLDGLMCVLIVYQMLLLLIPRPDESIATFFFLAGPRFF